MWSQGPGVLTAGSVVLCQSEHLRAQGLGLQLDGLRAVVRASPTYAPHFQTFAITSCRPDHALACFKRVMVTAVHAVRQSAMLGRGFAMVDVAAP